MGRLFFFSGCRRASADGRGWIGDEDAHADPTLDHVDRVDAPTEQVEAELGASMTAGLMAGNVADGTLWMGSTLKLRADWAAFIEEDYSRRYRIGIEVPLHERIALGIRPGVDFPFKVSGQPFAIGLGLRSYVYAIHIAWRGGAGLHATRKLLDALASTSVGQPARFSLGTTCRMMAQ